MNALVNLPSLTPIGGSTVNMKLVDRVRPGCSVVEMAGLVVVYDQDPDRFLPLEDGAFYVMEHQRPRSGMSWETAMRFSSFRFDTDREVVRVFRRPALTGDLWWYSHSNGRGPKFDGPMEDFSLADMIVGKVVGIYQPSALTEGMAA